jgi:predicted Zn-dependent protease
VPRFSAPAGFDRAAVLERLLAPRTAPAPPSASGASAKDVKKRAEAAAAYERGLVFFQQGAHAEAQKAFRDAEKKDGQNIEYIFATAYAHLRLHEAEDAHKRYDKIYKQQPTNLRALAGMAAADEEALNYREAVTAWQRYARMQLSSKEKRDAEVLLRTVQELFAERYEIAENPAGGAANLVTPEGELELGMQYAKQLAATGVPLVADAEIVRYVEGLSRTLVAHAKNFPTNYQVFVLDTANVNATTVPGFIFVYRGILEAADDESQLAGVLAHEIGHSVGHHSAKKLSKSYQDQQTLESLRQQDSKLARFLASLVDAGNPLGALSFSREQEAQADRLAVHIAFDAGYDPRGIAGFFLHLESLQPSSRKAWDLMRSTHPFSVDRMNTVTEYSALLPARSLRRSSPAFERMKARLRKLPSAPDATGLQVGSSAP